MLSLHPRPDRLRRADNLLPTREGSLATRPGAIQVIAGAVAQAKAWGDRILAEKLGRLVIWDGAEHDLCSSGRVLQASAFQALTADAAREDRLYVADGLRNLWYIARRGGAYVRDDVVNTVLDASGAPYPIPVPSAIATWRGRLWIGSGTNRAQHCQNDAPAEWDPLWTVECQGEDPDRIRALKAHGDTLAVGLGKTVWGITGSSQYNWDSNVVSKVGVTGANAIDSDGERLVCVAEGGVYQLGTAEPLSNDLRDMFTAPVGPGELVLDTRRRLLLVLVMGRLFCAHLDNAGIWGEIVGVRAAGLIRTANHVGWYGADGLWLLAGRDTADKRLDGTEVNFTSVYDTWTARPNVGGNGRALCNRTVLTVRGSARARVSYTVTATDGDRSRAFAGAATLTDQNIDGWSDDIAAATPLAWPTDEVRREFVPRVSGQSFRHVISAPCYMEILGFDPQYRFGAEAAA